MPEQSIVGDSALLLVVTHTPEIEVMEVKVEVVLPQVPPASYEAPISPKTAGLLPICREARVAVLVTGTQPVPQTPAECPFSAQDTYHRFGDVASEE